MQEKREPSLSGWLSFSYRTITSSPSTQTLLTMTYFSDLDDRQIIEGLQRHDEQITRDYFYGFCRIAYHLLDKSYHIRGQEGLDFYTLAHEYYLDLELKQWEPLKRCQAGVKLKTWMVNGFRYLMLDRIKDVERHRHESLETRLMRGSLKESIGFDEQQLNYGSVVDQLCRELNILAIDRQILISLLQEGYKSKEIAGMLGISPSAVSQRYHKLLNDKIIPYYKQREHLRPFEVRKCMPPTMESASALPGHGFALPNLYEQASEELSDFNIDTSSKHIYLRVPQWVYECYVYESNLFGLPLSSTAREAIAHHKALAGHVEGPCGESYAIPTMQGGIETIAPHVQRFTDYAKNHTDTLFTINEIGIDSGFDAYEIAPLFEEASRLDNVKLSATMLNAMF